MTTALPSSPSYQLACDIIDNEPLAFWLPLLVNIQNQYRLGEGEWSRVADGANALFEFEQGYIVKIVPPNWLHQGEKEIAADELFKQSKSDFPLNRPKIIAFADHNGWLYILMSKLPGTCLASLWPELTMDNKMLIIRQLGAYMRSLRALANHDSKVLTVRWHKYVQSLKENCLQRHQRNNLSSELYAQVLPFVEQHLADLPDAASMFVHMDLHPGNLMVEHKQGNWHLTGVLDFGDALFCHGPWLEILTPICFMAQGDSELYKTLLNSYGLIDGVDMNQLQNAMMALALVREASNINFVMQQVPSCIGMRNWEQIAQQLFPAINLG
ncbi:aminoglycoside phosphotransferase family protein [Litorilituus sediminis]|uniref:Aminoglycoside phosphotransferase family protein n=1 Tax=Litorilituus sediminis TaxID=718192 RepID=A0A4P6P5M8_9GAMM|nr:aminoglycoside phosphotransferase family protein [Litorilituus sediminis]QBG36754.1 aminoglycoside phosphotransferase family protein [Litorilituus sediminis]